MVGSQEGCHVHVKSERPLRQPGEVWSFRKPGICDGFLSLDQLCECYEGQVCVSAEKLTKGGGESGRLVEVVIPGLRYQDGVRDAMEYVTTVD